jgi:RNA polymerase sigma-70 factor, ECF subfamily
MPADGMIMTVEYDQRQPAALDAIERLFRAEAPNVWRSVLAYSGGRREIADEAVAEAFARAIAYEGRIRRPVAWLYQVSFRLAAAEMRRRRGEDVETLEVAVDPPEVAGVFEALRQLTPNQRAAVVLFHEVDLPVSEIADRMGISAATVRVHLHRGRKRLREILGDEEV